MRSGIRKIYYMIFLYAGIAAGAYFGAYRMVLVPLIQCLYRSHYGMLNMAFVIQCLLTASLGVVVTCVCGLAGLGIASLVPKDKRGMSVRPSVRNRRGQMRASIA